MEKNLIDLEQQGWTALSVAGFPPADTNLVS